MSDHIPFNPQGEAHDTTNRVALQARTDGRNPDGPRRSGAAGRVHPRARPAGTHRAVPPRTGEQPGLRPAVFVETVILLLQGGGRALEDLRELEREDALLALLGHEGLPDPDTVGDWLRRMGDPHTGQAGLEGLGQVRDALTARLLRRDGVEAYTLDVDATLIEAEKRDAQWSYQGVKGYMPLLGFLFETPVCLVDEFREGNISPGTGHLAFYRACQARLPAGKRLGAYRADSASYQAELINALETDEVRWAITADQDAAVKALLRALPEDAWTEPVPGGGYGSEERRVGKECTSWCRSRWSPYH